MSASIAIGVSESFPNQLLYRPYGGVVLGGVASTPVHAKETETHLIGRKVGDRVIDEGAEIASQFLGPPFDIRATPEYRLKMTSVFAKRVIGLALSCTRAGA